MGACAFNIPVAKPQTVVVIGTCVLEQEDRKKPEEEEDKHKRERTPFPETGSADDVLLWMRHNLPFGLNQQDTQYLLNKQLVERMPATQLLVTMNMIQLASSAHEDIFEMTDNEVRANLAMARVMWN